MDKPVKHSYEFVNKLLENSSLTTFQRERILRLVSNKLTKDLSNQDKIKDRLNILEAKLGLKYKPNEEADVIEEPEVVYPPISGRNKLNSSKIRKRDEHQPKKIVEWLNLFHQESAIKYSTHLWDDKKLFPTYRDFIKQIQQEFKEYNFYDMPKYNSNLYYEKIYPFLFQYQLTSIEGSGDKKYSWGRYKIKIGWQYPKTVQNWCVENYDKPVIQNKTTPFEMPIPGDLKPDNPIDGKTIQFFENVIEVFKKEIEFRDNDLYKVFRFLTAKYGRYLDVDQNDIKKLKGVSFYTNTEHIEMALENIFQMIKERATEDSKKVKIRCKKNENSYELEIVHLHSFSLKDLDHPKLQIPENYGSMAGLRNKFRSLCHFSIQSKFRNKSGVLGDYEIAYLYDGVKKENWKPKITPLDEEAVGFVYKMIFVV